MRHWGTSSLLPEEWKIVWRTHDAISSMFIKGTSELEVIILHSSLPCHIISVVSEFSSP